MIRNLMLCGFLSIMFACNGAEKKENSIPGDFSKNSPEQTISNKDEGLNTDSENSVLEKSKEVENKADEDEQDKMVGNIQEEQDRRVVEKSSNSSTEIIETTSSTPIETITPSKKNDIQEKKQQPNIILISVVPDIMKFDKEVFTVVAGQEVIIEFYNPDGMQHNLVISKPGTLKEVGAAADALARDPKGAQKEYVPEIPAVLFATKQLEPEEVVTLTFTAPSEPGDYPFICTFPGHWSMMNGIMKVTE